MSNTYFIPGNTPSSKNSKRCIGGVAIHSKTTKKWLDNMKVQLAFSLQRQAFLKELEGLPLPYYVEFTFIRGSRHKFDYHNLVQVVVDQMVIHGWLLDDNADIIKCYFGDYSYDVYKPGVQIKILKQKPIH